jgi:3-phytase
MIKLLTVLLFLSSCVLGNSNPIFFTTSVKGDADECAFWVNVKDPSKSLLIGNDKKENGALYMWDLKGDFVYKTPVINRPVGVDVRYQIKLGNELIDVAICAVRSSNELKVFKIDPEKRTLIDITTEKKIPSYQIDETYGVSLYKRKSDGKLFVFTSSKKKENIHQILLTDNNGKIEGTLMRSFGKEDQKSFVEGMCVDDELGYFYCSDERAAILKYYADPDMKDDHLLLRFAVNDGIKGDREGLALYKKDDLTGFIILSSQGNSSFKIYQRENGNSFVKTCYPKGVRHTDGLDAVNIKVSPDFPEGIIACHNSSGKNFAIYSWKTFFEN